jgi:hypothetical protein
VEGENVEIVRRMVEGVRAYWSVGEPWGTAIGPFYEANVDYYPVRKWPESHPCHGIEEFQSFMAQWTDAWDEVDWEPLEIEPVSDDRVWMRARFAASGRGSGLEMDGVVHFAFWLRGGRIFRQEDHLTEAGARRALGLRR